MTVGQAAQATLIAVATPGTIAYNGTSALTITGGTGSGAVTYAVATGGSNCSIVSSTLTGTGIGACTVTATKAGDTNYTSATSAAITVTVGQAAQTTLIAVATPASLAYNGTSALWITGGTGSGAVKYAVASGGNNCVIEGSTLTGRGIGSCTVTATKAGDTNYTSATSAAITVTVGQAAQTTLIAVATPASLAYNGTSALWITGGTGSGAVKYAVASGGNNCVIEGSTLTGRGIGSCTVTATKAGDTNYPTATSAAIPVTVGQASQTITFVNPGQHGAGSPLILAPTASSGLPVSLYSGTPGVCTLAGTTVNLQAPGTCTISASQGGNSNYLPASDVLQSFQVLAVNQSQTITFFPIGNLALGTKPFLLGATSSAGLAVSFTSTTTSVCTVSGAVVTLAATGTCSLNADQSGTALYGAAATVTQSFVVRAAPACSYSLNADGTHVPVDRSNWAFRILTTPGCVWTAVPGVGWITLTSGSSGTDSGEVGFTASANDSGAPRTGTITAGGQTYSVLQFASACSFALSSGSAALPAAGGSLTLEVSASAAGCVWTSLPSSANVTITPATGTAPGQVTIAVAANSGVSTSNFAPVIGGQIFNISEAGINCGATLSASSASFHASGGTGSVDVTVPAGCTYSVLPGSSWLSITSGSTGTAAGGGPQTYRLLYTVDASSSAAARSGVLRIGGADLSVWQQSLACTVTLDTTALGTPFGNAGGTGSIHVASNSAGCAWLAGSPDPWITLSASAGTGNSTVTVTVAANSSGVPRDSNIILGGQVVAIAQVGSSCSYSLRSADATLPAVGGTASVGVMAASGCTWASSANAAWLTIYGSGSSGSGDVSFRATANPGNLPRTGSLTVAGKPYAVTQGGAVCSYNLSRGSAVFGAGGGSGSVTFNTTVNGCTPPPAATRANWLSVSQVFSGTSGTITYAITASTSDSPRTATILIGDQTFSLSQAAATCAYTLSLTSAVFGPTGGTANITATASGVGCIPTVSSPAGMVTLGGISGPVANVFTQAYTVAPFSSATNATRVTSVNVGGNLFQIKQRSF